MAHASVKQNLDNEIANMYAQLKGATHAKQVSSEPLAQAEKDLALDSATQSWLREDLGYRCLSLGMEAACEFGDAPFELRKLQGNHRFKRHSAGRWAANERAVSQSQPRWMRNIGCWHIVIGSETPRVIADPYSQLQLVRNAHR